MIMSHIVVTTHKYLVSCIYFYTNLLTSL